MLGGVTLTQAQREAVCQAFEARTSGEAERATMAKRHEAMRAAMSEKLATFAGDSFDAKAFIAPPEGEKAGGSGDPFGQMVSDLAVVVPLLDAEQREVIAARLEKRPPAFAWRPGGHGGPTGL